MWPVIASRLEEEGYGFFKFNFRGCGEREKSEGKFEDITLSARIKDFQSALDFLEERNVVDMARIGVVGASLGGMVALGSQDERRKAIVTMGTPYKVPRYEEPRIPEKEGEYYVLPSGKKFKPEFYEDIKEYDLREYLKVVPPVLIIQGGSDEVVPMEHARIMYDYARKPKRLEIIETADHLFTDSEDLETAIDFIIDWFDEYL